MVIRRKSSIDKKNYELSGQLSLFGRDNLYLKTVNLPKAQKYVNLCRIVNLKKILIHKKLFLSFIRIQ